MINSFLVYVLQRTSRSSALTGATDAHRRRKRKGMLSPRILVQSGSRSLRRSCSPHWPISTKRALTRSHSCHHTKVRAMRRIDFVRAPEDKKYLWRHVFLRRLLAQSTSSRCPPGARCPVAVCGRPRLVSVQRPSPRPCRSLFRRAAHKSPAVAPSTASAPRSCIVSHKGRGGGVGPRGQMDLSVGGARNTGS